MYGLPTIRIGSRHIVYYSGGNRLGIHSEAATQTTPGRAAQNRRIPRRSPCDLALPVELALRVVVNGRLAHSTCCVTCSATRPLFPPTTGCMNLRRSSNNTFSSDASEATIHLQLKASHPPFSPLRCYDPHDADALRSPSAAPAGRHRHGGRQRPQVNGSPPGGRCRT